MNCSFIFKTKKKKSRRQGLKKRKEFSDSLNQCNGVEISR